MSTRIRRISGGFTLIELLVVIGIIGILMGLLLPTISRVRESANTVKCAAQLRQIGQGIINYASSNGGLLPAWSGSHSYPNDFKTDDPDGPGWIALIERYTGVHADSPIYTCPAMRGEDRVVTYFLAARYCGSLQPPTKSFPISRIKLSSQFVLSGDVSNQGWYPPPIGTWNQTFDNVDKDDNLMACLLFFGDEGGFNMHRAGNNALFADGHVAAYKKFEPQNLTFHPTERHDWQDAGGNNTP